jgi:LPPG:FO 2-phospho-L-lactate transferase
VIVALAGGVGAARLLRGMIDAIDPGDITAVVNTGDDVVLHGLCISPDLDTVTYTLADAINRETGWGLAGETWGAMESLRAYGDGRLAWFNLGDRDIGTHLYRTSRLTEGAALSQVASEIAARWGVAVHLVPMSDQRVETRVTVAEPTGEEVEIGFQDFFVGRHHDIAVKGLRLEGIERSLPAPGVLDAIATATRIIICPSNPLVSIGPILAVPGITSALQARRADVVAVSPIIAGRAVKGPADRMMSDLGHEPSVVGVARIYAEVASVLVVDEADASLASAVQAAGLGCEIFPTLMSGPVEAKALAQCVLSVELGR